MEETTKKPSVGMVEKGKGFMPIVFMPTDVCSAIRQELSHRATTDAELAKAINNGKKTFEGCYRFIINNIKSACAEARKQNCEFSNDDTFAMAEYYFKNHEITDVKATQTPTITKPKTEQKVFELNPKNQPSKPTPTPKKETRKPDTDGQLSLF